MSKYIVDIHGEIEGDYDIIGKYEEPKVGHWICYEEQFNTLGIAIAGGVKCSECGYTTHNKLHMELGCPYKYCPNCGAKMESEVAE